MRQCQIRGLLAAAVLALAALPVRAQVSFTLRTSPEVARLALQRVAERRGLTAELSEFLHELRGIPTAAAPSSCNGATAGVAVVVLEPKGGAIDGLVRVDWTTPRGRCNAPSEIERGLVSELRAAASTPAALVVATDSARPVSSANAVILAAEYGRQDADLVPVNQGGHFFTGLLLGPLGVLLAYTSAESHDIAPPVARLQEVAKSGDLALLEYQRTFATRVSRRRQGSALGAAAAGFAAATVTYVVLLDRALNQVSNP